jgi:hypothetical protein
MTDGPNHAIPETAGHARSAVPGHLDYGLPQGATLKVDIDEGHFVFFHIPVDL